MLYTYEINHIRFVKLLHVCSIRRASNIGRISGHVTRGYVVINNNTCYDNNNIGRVGLGPKRAP